MNIKKKIIALVSATAVAMASLAGTVGASAVFSTSDVQEESTQILNAAGTYTISPGTKVVCSQLPASDKMIGWEWSEFGIGANEKVQKVEFKVSTPASSIGKWQGAFGTSTSAAPDHWAQTDDMTETISGKSGTITWNVDSATSAIIQTQYGGELKMGFWWVDCDTVTIDSITVYTDAKGTTTTAI